jgi:hypothetical protein
VRVKRIAVMRKPEHHDSELVSGHPVPDEHAVGHFHDIIDDLCAPMHAAILVSSQSLEFET